MSDLPNGQSDSKLILRTLLVSQLAETGPCINIRLHSSRRLFIRMLSLYITRPCMSRIAYDRILYIEGENHLFCKDPISLLVPSPSQENLGYKLPIRLLSMHK